MRKTWHNNFPMEWNETKAARKKTRRQLYIHTSTTGFRMMKVRMVAFFPCEMMQMGEKGNVIRRMKSTFAA
jgi:hypothetical protein